MANMSLIKNPMPSQEPDVRNKNFDEVALGYTKEQALDEAQRCLNCKNRPCVGGCPVNVNIPDFIKKITERDYEGAYQVINATSSLPAVCGRVCPQETQCESKCVRGIKGEPVAIGRLERFGRGRPGLGVVSLEVVDGAEDLAGGFVVGVPARFRRGRIR